LKPRHGGSLGRRPWSRSVSDPTGSIPIGDTCGGNERVALQPRPLAVLGYLAARPGTVIGRDELIQKLWVGTFVTKAVIKVAVRAIREVLGDDAASPLYIETVGRDGYRFIGATVDPEIDAIRASPRPAPSLSST
jgi:DNA-binding winged helix-turn-helix (wHTH) protein